MILIVERAGIMGLYSSFSWQHAQVLDRSLRVPTSGVLTWNTLLDPSVGPVGLPVPRWHLNFDLTTSFSAFISFHRQDLSL